LAYNHVDHPAGALASRESFRIVLRLNCGYRRQEQPDPRKIEMITSASRSLALQLAEFCFELLIEHFIETFIA